MCETHSLYKLKTDSKIVRMQHNSVYSVYIINYCNYLF